MEESGQRAGEVRFEPPEESTLRSIRRELALWYASNKRDLPWRHTSDPYAVWVSEAMLQQTRVETVLDYWPRFLERFPTVRALAEAEDCLNLTLTSGGQITDQQVRWQPVAILHAKDHLLITIRDLSPERKALQQQQRFMTDLTHELRTPLTIISGSLKRLTRDSQPNQRSHRHLIRAEEETLRIHRLLEHLSLMTRLEVDPDWLGVRVQPLRPVLEQWLEDTPQDRQQRLSIDWGDLSPSAQVRMDANALVIALDQLVDNAIQHGDDESGIRVVFRCPGSRFKDSCSLQVCSSGFGAVLKQDSLDRWLLPFVRSVAQRDEASAEGAGLGLAMVNSLVRAWGGAVELDQRKDADQPATTITCVSLTMPLIRP